MAFLNKKITKILKRSRKPQNKGCLHRSTLFHLPSSDDAIVSRLERLSQSLFSISFLSNRAVCNILICHITFLWEHSFGRKKSNKTKWPRQVRELILDSDSEIIDFWSFDEKNDGEIFGISCIFCIFCISCIFCTFFLITLLLSSPFQKHITS